MKSILIVDDIQEYSDSLVYFLTKKDVVARTAASLEESKRIIEASPPDVAIIDIRLSETDLRNRDGLVLMRWLREKGFKTKVIVISAYRDFDAAIEAINEGARYFLKKPINLEEMENRVRELLDEF